jgi:hypothetical protein
MYIKKLDHGPRSLGLRIFKLDFFTLIRDYPSTRILAPALIIVLHLSTQINNDKSLQRYEKNSAAYVRLFGNTFLKIGRLAFNTVVHKI